MFIKDPIITKKIHFIKGILKNFVPVSRENKRVHKNIQRLFSKNIAFWHSNQWSTDDQIKLKLENYLDFPWDEDNITAIHIYYLKLKGVSKQHTKDDKTYENSRNYKATIDRLESEFLVSQDAGKEGLYVK
jgi:hypothetical protein